MNTKTKPKARRRRRKGEGTRGPRKGHGGRPAKTVDVIPRSIRLDLKEWGKLFRHSSGTSYTDRVRDLITLAARSTKRDRAKLRTAWKVIMETDRRGAMVAPNDQSIRLGREEWEAFASLLPLGSWADKLRQALDLARAVTDRDKERAKARK